MKDLILNILSIIILLAGLIVNIIFRDQFNGEIFFRIIGMLITITGVIIWIIARITLGKYFTMSTIPKGLITNGIYSKLRHPMYYGGILIYIGGGLFFRSIVGLIFTVILILPMLIYFAIEEDKLLRLKFKEKYSNYKLKTIL